MRVVRGGKDVLHPSIMNMSWKNLDVSSVSCPIVAILEDHRYIPNELQSV